MADIKSFRGIIYNQTKIRNLSLTIAPPYDVISEEGKDRLHHQSPYNIVRIILGQTKPEDSAEQNQYTRAAEFLQTWLREGILQQDQESCLYAMEDEYTLPGCGKKSIRHGFMALVKLEDFGTGQILPHEKTLSAPKEDRLRLIRTCRTNLSPIFGFYSDPHKKINSLLYEAKKKTRPFIDILSQERILHRVFRVSTPALLEEIVAEMHSKPILIADGHHRYETALNYCREMTKNLSPHDPLYQEYTYVMIYLANMDEEGLTILPYHRLLKNLPPEVSSNWKQLLEPYFKIETFPFNGLSSTEGQARERFFSRLAERDSLSIPAFGLYCGDHHYYLLTLRDTIDLEKEIPGEQSTLYKRLDVTILDHLVVKKTLNSDSSELREKCLGFSHDALEAISLVNSNRYQTALFLNPTKIHQVYEIASRGEKMPQKSTFFYPKLPTGLVLRRIDDLE